MKPVLKNAQNPLHDLVGTQITAVDADIGIFEVQPPTFGVKHRETLARSHGNPPAVHVVDSGLQAFGIGIQMTDHSTGFEMLHGFLAVNHAAPRGDHMRLD